MKHWMTIAWDISSTELAGPYVTEESARDHARQLLEVNEHAGIFPIEMTEVVDEPALGNPKWTLSDGGNSYRLELYEGKYCLEHAGIFTDGKVDEYGEVDFSRGLDEEQTLECRRIEKALLTAMGVVK